MGKGTTWKGLSITKAQQLLYDDFVAWMDDEKGNQYGVFNFIGPAGSGKTESIHQVADRLKGEGKGSGVVVELFLSALMDPESAAGCPVPEDIVLNGEKTKVLKMAWREELVRAKAAGKGYILFIDEIGREADQLRPLILKLLHEKGSWWFEC